MGRLRKMKCRAGSVWDGFEFRLKQKIYPILIIHLSQSKTKISKVKILIKLYAPKRCDRFFGIFQEYSMEYSIFQNFPYFDCVPFFLEYSWNIPYSNFYYISIVYRFFWNIPCDIPYSKIVHIFP